MTKAQDAAAGDFMYQASVPVFERYLQQIGGLLDKLEQHARNRSTNSAALLQSRLSLDMHTCADQVAIACNFALRSCARLAGLAVPPYGDFEPTPDGLRQRIAYVRDFLQTLTAAQMRGSDSRNIVGDAS